MVPQQQRRRRRRAALARTSERRVVVLRGPGGFGFTIAGQRPCVVSAVAAGGPAERAGLRAGDALLAVDGASVSRAPHAAVARLVAAAPQAIALSVAPRESPPTDTEDTEPDERARTRRRHPPPRRRLQHPPLMHLPGCHAAPSTSGVKEILHNLSRSQFSPSSQAARLECRAVVGYLGTIETPTAASETPPSSVRTAVRRLRQERRPAAPVLLSVLPNVLMLRRPNGQTLAQYPRERIVYAGCGSDVDRRYFGLVTAAESSDNDEVSHSCHVFAVDPRLAEHEAHEGRSREFQIVCTRDPVVERCLEFPPSSEYVVGIIKGMYSLPADDCTSPSLLQISKLAIKGDSPALANFSRNNRALRVPRLARRPNRYEEYQPGPDGHEFVANSPQPSNHSEITTTSSNSDSGIGFHNDGRNIADRILVVDFGIQQPPPLRYPALRRPLGLVGVEDGAFLSNTTPVVDGFGGQGRPLDHREDVMLNPSDMQPIQPLYSPRKNEDSADMYNYNNVYGNIPSCSRTFPNGVVYDQVYTENEGHYELIPVHNDSDQVSQPTEGFNSVEIYEENRFNPESFEAESVENVTVVSGTASKASMDSVSIYSCRSHEEARPTRMRHLQASLDDMLVLGLRDDHNAKDDGHFVHPANVKFKSRKSKPLNILSRTKQILTGRDRSEKRRESLGRARALSASAGDVCEDAASVPAAASEPDLRDSGQSVETSPFRRWTTGSGAGSSLRHHDHRNMYNKQMSEGTALAERCSSGNVGNVARWSLGLEQLLADPAGAAAFDHFLRNEFAHENIRFWWACEQYRTCADESKREQMAQEIWQRHLAEGAHESVNIDAAARRAADARRSQWPADPDIFLQAQKHIFNLMKLDSYPRFLRSSVHAECARANLCGLPPPYETRGTPEREPTPTKLKKSASNASDRRRSGTSLLWKLRAVSKDRAQNASTNSVVSNSDTASTHDVVTSSTTPAGCSLCRVVLPDRSTSVVEVNSAVPVKRLIDKMLDKRKIQCHSYDVLLKNGSQSTTTLVDSASPSTILGGREALVEQRCVVRLELCGRCVAVRCRPQRKLKHALKPVLARYCSALQDASVSAWRDNERVHEDTSMLDLDGERLQIILTSNEDRHSDFHTLEREEDTEFPGDLAVRLNDDVDTLSATSSAGRSEASGAGRVRATLRAGPPLHHHPPDFLENLRETQRLRLQNRSESGSGSGSGPEPRSPPPLPPKPR